jgi:hypothetical protein
VEPLAPINPESPPLEDADTTEEVTLVAPGIGEDGLESMGFIYEEPTSNYWKSKSWLDGLGAFNYDLWNEMKCIHFILPNMTTAVKQ